MKGSANLENVLYQNAAIGASSIKKIYPNVKNKKLKSELKHQFEEYRKQTGLISGQLKSKNLHPAGVPFLTKLAVNADLRLNSVMNNSPGNYVKMMIQGSNMGMIRINQALNNSVGESPRVISEAKSILSKEQRYVNRLKEFL